MERQEQEISSIGVCEFLVYYKKKPTLVPMATIVGTIVAQTDSTQQSGSDLANIWTVLVNSSDEKTNSDAEEVRNSQNVTIIWANSTKAMIEICGQSGHGIVVSKDSVIKIRGDLVFRGSDHSEKTMRGTGERRMMVRKGVLHILVLDNEVIITQREGCQLSFADGSQTKSSPEERSQTRGLYRAQESNASEGPPVPERLSQSRPPNK